MMKLILVFVSLTFFHSQEQNMNDPMQLYTLGLWTVKEGNEQLFIEEWDRFAKWTSRHHPGPGSAYLLQELENPRQFISFGPWKDTVAIKKWREDPEFKKFVARAKELCESFRPHTLKVVATSN